MLTDKQKVQGSTHLRVKREKNSRLGKVSRLLAAEQDEEVSISALADEILEDGLKKYEKKLGIKYK